MTMELKPFKEIIAMSEEKINEAMAPIRAKKVKSQAQLEMAQLEADILEKEGEIQEIFIKKEINFPNVMEALDELTLLQHRQKQYEDVLGQLFPEKEGKK